KRDIENGKTFFMQTDEIAKKIDTEQFRRSFLKCLNDPVFTPIERLLMIKRFGLDGKKEKRTLVALRDNYLPSVTTKESIRIHLRKALLKIEKGLRTGRFNKYGLKEFSGYFDLIE
ncbi:hypothetical protein IJS77_00640, partial [bacterium]|nr:hypothetical protein [bacterium]